MIQSRQLFFYHIFHLFHDFRQHSVSDCWTAGNWISWFSRFQELSKSWTFQNIEWKLIASNGIDQSFGYGFLSNVISRKLFLSFFFLTRKADIVVWSLGLLLSDFECWRLFVAFNLRSMYLAWCFGQHLFKWVIKFEEAFVENFTLALQCLHCAILCSFVESKNLAWSSDSFDCSTSQFSLSCSSSLCIILCNKTKSIVICLVRKNRIG